jgi:hypothetical protein
MRNVLKLGIGVAALVLAFGGGSAAAQTFNSGSTGADGAFSPTATTTLTLPPSGVFNFTTVNIPSGVTVRFTKNVSNTPVTILASGNVTIAGTIDVGGAPGGGGAGQTVLAPNGGRGGPGGFDGGSGSNGIASTIGGAGLGPGGGSGGVPSVSFDAGGGFGTAGSAPCGLPGTGPAYGTATLLPLIGGSGGGGSGVNGFGQTGGGGGGGGGAVLIASSGTITLTGTILASGGLGGPSNGGPDGGAGGSGGGVRLVATTIAGSGGTIDARGAGGGTGCDGVGGFGRIRVETFTNTAAVAFNGVPPSITTQPAAVALSNTPTLRIASVAGVNAPAAPAGSLASPDITLPAGTTSPVAVTIAGANIPVGTTVTVTAKGQVGSGSSANATLSGSLASSTASASVTIPTNEPSSISASASFTLAASSGGGPVYAEGEEVERVRVSASLGGPMQVAYITKSGREIIVGPGR